MHESESEDAPSRLTLSDLMDLSLPGSSIHEIVQARVLKWVAIAFSDNQLVLLKKKFKIIEYQFKLQFFGLYVQLLQQHLDDAFFSH